MEQGEPCFVTIVGYLLRRTKVDIINNAVSSIGLGHLPHAQESGRFNSSDCDFFIETFKYMNIYL